MILPLEIRGPLPPEDMLVRAMNMSWNGWLGVVVVLAVTAIAGRRLLARKRT